MSAATVQIKPRTMARVAVDGGEPARSGTRSQGADSKLTSVAHRAEHESARAEKLVSGAEHNREGERDERPAHALTLSLAARARAKMRLNLDRCFRLVAVTPVPASARPYCVEAARLDTACEDGADASRPASVSLVRTRIVALVLASALVGLYSRLARKSIL